MIKFVIFDFDGTLVTSITRVFGRYRKRFEGFGREEWRRARVAKISEERFWKLLAEKHGLDEERLKRDFYSASKLRKSVLETAKELRQRYTLVLASNHIPKLFRHIDRKYEITKNFDYVFTSFGMRMGKQDERFFRRMLKRINAKPGECVLVDDREDVIKIARSLGIRAVHITDARRLPSQLRKAGVDI